MNNNHIITVLRWFVKLGLTCAGIWMLAAVGCWSVPGMLTGAAALAVLVVLAAAFGEVRNDQFN